MNPKIMLGLALGVACSIIWGGHAVVARPALAGQGFHPLDLAAFRYAPAALLLAPLAWRARVALARIGWKRLMVLSFFGGAPNLLLFVCALLYAPASHGGTIAPMVMPVAGALLAITRSSPVNRSWSIRQAAWIVSRRSTLASAPKKRTVWPQNDAAE